MQSNECKILSSYACLKVCKMMLKICPNSIIYIHLGLIFKNYLNATKNSYYFRWTLSSLDPKY
jgi:hypothetical protein